MAGKAVEGQQQESQEGEGEVRWRVTDGSCEAEVHPATNVLKRELFRVWQTRLPCDHAWLVLEPRPPAAFCAVEIVNAGSALVELYGLRDGAARDADYELLLSPQQVILSVLAPRLVVWFSWEARSVLWLNMQGICNAGEIECFLCCCSW